MRKVVDIIWVEDKKEYLPSIKDEIEEIQRDFNVVLEIDHKTDGTEFQNIAGNIPSDLIFCIDYNLKQPKGKGIDGDEVIRKIREVNKTCWIFFYSAKKNQEELRALVNSDDQYVICQHRTQLLDSIRGLFSDNFI